MTMSNVITFLMFDSSVKSIDDAVVIQFRRLLDWMALSFDGSIFNFKLANGIVTLEYSGDGLSQIILHELEELCHGMPRIISMGDSASIKSRSPAQLVDHGEHDEYRSLDDWCQELGVPLENMRKLATDLPWYPCTTAELKVIKAYALSDVRRLYANLLQDHTTESGE
jgi:hypothetical protein